MLRSWRAAMAARGKADVRPYASNSLNRARSSGLIAAVHKQSWHGEEDAMHVLNWDFERPEHVGCRRVWEGARTTARSASGDPGSDRGGAGKVRGGCQGRAGPSIVPPEELEKRRKRTRAVDDAPDWPDLGLHGPLKSCANCRCGIDALGVARRYDEFHDRISIECNPIQYLTGANLAATGHIVRIAMYERWSFDPGKDNIHNALVQVAVTQRFDPMRE
jgi:hypothetical protein